MGMCHGLSLYHCPFVPLPLLNSLLPSFPPFFLKSDPPSLFLSTSFPFLISSCIWGLGKACDRWRSAGIPSPVTTSPTFLSQTACSCLHHGHLEHSLLTSDADSCLSAPDSRLKAQGLTSSSTQTPPIPEKLAAAWLPKHDDVPHRGTGPSA